MRDCAAMMSGRPHRGAARTGWRKLRLESPLAALARGTTIARCRSAGFVDEARESGGELAILKVEYSRDEHPVSGDALIALASGYEIFP
jgi:hypothetical protein